MMLTDSSRLWLIGWIKSIVSFLDGVEMMHKLVLPTLVVELDHSKCAQWR